MLHKEGLQKETLKCCKADRICKDERKGYHQRRIIREIAATNAEARSVMTCCTFIPSMGSIIRTVPEVPIAIGSEGWHFLCKSEPALRDSSIVYPVIGYMGTGHLSRRLIIRIPRLMRWGGARRCQDVVVVRSAWNAGRPARHSVEWPCWASWDNHLIPMLHPRLTISVHKLRNAVTRHIVLMTLIAWVPLCAVRMAIGIGVASMLMRQWKRTTGFLFNRRQDHVLFRSAPGYTRTRRVDHGCRSFETRCKSGSAVIVTLGRKHSR
ncbi:hypothetical protein CC80DRAFT_83100 [Byssothecium circinans]|uniref:Uncharacterized protein n=1 Tax=Byssothecium circinans TaxID=147558 RepID=A0A6A5TWG4_9PLEO|nr:hypothetical protein CC80DRAFT_83100 [Byssothecium circinans]